MKMQSKSIFKSKTFWVNSLIVIFATLGGLGIVQIDDAPGAADQIASAIVAGVGAVNLVLRIATKQPVTLTDK
jgi:hypothetical protein